MERVGETVDEMEGLVSSPLVQAAGFISEAELPSLPSVPDLLPALPVIPTFPELMAKGLDVGLDTMYNSVSNNKVQECVMQTICYVTTHTKKSSRQARIFGSWKSNNTYQEKFTSGQNIWKL